MACILHIFVAKKLLFLYQRDIRYFDMLLLTPKAHINLSWSNR